ncbi:hypothetical protein ACLMAL_31340 [Nocardia sp. CWNU-33]|uniref:hypothetical protein n=1 Tax=Nocardia sp. CWNU-33 TaxID=3392117 RepID=UPI00398EDFD1
MKKHGHITNVEVEITYSCDANGTHGASRDQGGEGTRHNNTDSASGRAIGIPICDGKSHTSSATVASAADSIASFQPGDSVRVIVEFLDDAGKLLHNSTQSEQLTLT